jgi:hypothetical protein
VFARAVFAGFLAIAVLQLAGCGPAKLYEKKQYQMEPGLARAMDLSAQSKPQTLSVEFSSSDGKVSVLVVKQEDAPSEDDLIGVPASKAIASKVRETSGSFTAEVPANTATRVIVRDAEKNTDVTLHVTNRK